MPTQPCKGLVAWQVEVKKHLLLSLYVWMCELPLRCISMHVNCELSEIYVDNPF